MNESRGFVSLRHVSLLDGILKESQEVGEKYLQSLDIDRFVAPSYEAHGLTPKKERYSGWEARTISGHSLGHFMSALAVTFLATGKMHFKTTLDYAVSELAAIQAFTGNSYIGGIPETPFTNSFNGSAQISRFDIDGYWVPWYSIHKIYRGLIDAYKLTGNMLALDVVSKFGDWAVSGLGKMTDEQIQEMLECEYGGMNDVFAQLYGIIGNPDYLKAATAFTHKSIIDPLERKVDELQGKHSNTQIPKVIGAAEIYNQDSSYESYKTAARFFWNTVVQNRSYVMGGSSINEHFEAIGMESPGTKTAEACFTHNMLILSKQLFEWEPNSAYFDYYEHALYNHILGTQDPCTGNKTYFTSTLQGHYRIYGTNDTAWWCCTGTGMENPAKYGEAVYFEDRDDLYVNLYFPSRLEWEAKGLEIELDTTFPYTNTVTMHIKKGRNFANLKMRIPNWIASPVVAIVNEKERYTQSDTGYLTISGTWKEGDQIVITLPMELRKYTARDRESKIAFFYGPILLAGKFGSEDLPADTIVDETVVDTKTASVPILWTESEDLNSWIVMKNADTLTFEISEKVTSDQKPVTIAPFYSIHHEFYNLYWNLNDEGDSFEKKLNEVSIDAVYPDGQQDEIGHQFHGNCLSTQHNGSIIDAQNKMHMWRDAYGISDAYISYKLAVDGTSKNYLCVSYWGGDYSPFTSNGVTYAREFFVLVDHVIVGEQSIHFNKIDHVFYVAYDINESITEGKSSITVTFKAKSENCCAGRVTGVRITRSRIEQ